MKVLTSSEHTVWNTSRWVESEESSSRIFGILVDLFKGGSFNQYVVVEKAKGGATSSTVMAPYFQGQSVCAYCLGAGHTEKINFELKSRQKRHVSGFIL